MDDEDRAELVYRLFALLTAELEDGAALAMEGQGKQQLAAQHGRAQLLEAKVRDAQTIAQSVVMLTQPPISAL